MILKGPVACLLATLISVLATVTVAADTDSDSSATATAAHGLSEARAAVLAVKKEKRQVDRAEFYKDLDTVWDECPRFIPTSELSCDPSTLTSKCTYGNPYSKLCEDPDGKCKRRKQCKCVAGKFTCTTIVHSSVPSVGPSLGPSMSMSLTPTMEPSIEPNVPYSFDSPSGCTSVEALSSNKFRLTSSSGKWRCGICGTTPITGFEFTIPDYTIHFAIGLNRATSACQSVSFEMDHGWKFRGRTPNSERSIEKWEYYTGTRVWSTLGTYLTTDVFGMALHNGKVHYLKNGVVISESPMVPDVDYWFDYSIVTLAADNTAGIEVTFVDPLSHWDVLSVGPTGSVNPTTIYTEDFNSINAPLGHFNGGPNGQSTARHDLVYGADLMTGWTKSSSFTHDIHCVDTANTWSGGVVSTNPQNWGIMIYATTIITQSDGIVGSNTIGTQYSIDFLAAGAVYQITSQVNNGSNDKLLVEVLRALDNAVLHSFNHIPAAPVGVGNLGLLPVSFAYTGDGSGNIKFRIGSGNPGQGRFQGTIDDLSLSRLSN